MGQNLFPLILPKNIYFDYSKTILAIFCCLVCLLGVPRTIYIGGLSLYFDNFFASKMVGSRETSATRACWSLDEVVGDLRSLVCPFVRPFVCPDVTRFLGNRSLLFSEKIGGKNFLTQNRVFGSICFYTN